VVRNNTFQSCETAMLLGGGRNVTIVDNFANNSNTFLVFLNEGMNWMHATCVQALQGLSQLLSGPANTSIDKLWPELRNIPQRLPCNPYGSRIVGNVYANTTDFLQPDTTLQDAASWGAVLANNTDLTPGPPWVNNVSCLANTTHPPRKYIDCEFEVVVGMFLSGATAPYQNLTLVAHADLDDCFRVDGCGTRGPAAASCASGFNLTARYVVSSNGSFVGDGSCCTPSVTNRVLRWRRLRSATC